MRIVNGSGPARRWLWTGMACAGLLLGGDVEAGTGYFVHQSHPAASDDNPGTQEEPWQTIGASLDRVEAGDTVHVREGVYREQMILAGEPWHFGGQVHSGFPSGESYARMVAFEAWPNEEVTIKGSDVVEAWDHHEGDVWVREDWLHNSQQVFVDGEPLQQIAGEMVEQVAMDDRYRGRVGEGLDDLREGAFYVDRDASRLYVWLPGGADPNEHMIEASVRPFFFALWGVDYVRISGFRMRHSNTSAEINWAAIRLGGSHHILEDLDVAWCDFIALTVRGDNSTIVNSRFNHNGNSGIGGGGWGHRFINCETSHNNNRNWNPNWHAGGVKIIPGAHDVVMSGHVASHNNGHGIWFDAWMSNVTLRDSVAHHNAGMGIFYEIGERGVIKNNRVYENQGRGIYVADSADTLVAHNLAYRNGMSGIVVIGTGRAGDLFGHAGENVLYVRNNVVWGNILMDNNWPPLAPAEWGNRPELILPDDRPSNRNNTSDYNLFYRSDDRPIVFWEGWQGGEHPGIDAWREATGNDRHSQVGEPLFVDVAEHNFRPAPGSAAIGVVRPHMSVSHDAAGQERPLRTGETYYTVGPYEPLAE